MAPAPVDEDVDVDVFVQQAIRGFGSLIHGRVNNGGRGATPSTPLSDLVRQHWEHITSLAATLSSDPLLESLTDNHVHLFMKRSWLLHVSSAVVQVVERYRSMDDSAAAPSTK